MMRSVSGGIDGKSTVLIRMGVGKFSYDAGGDSFFQ
jgi:hypothetical protein